MKVKDFITHLQKFNPELDVYLSKDGEGNEFKPLSNEPFYSCYHDGEEEFLSSEDYMDSYDEEVEENTLVLFPSW